MHLSKNLAGTFKAKSHILRYFDGLQRQTYISFLQGQLSIYTDWARRAWVRELVVLPQKTLEACAQPLYDSQDCGSQCWLHVTKSAMELERLKVLQTY